MFSNPLYSQNFSIYENYSALKSELGNTTYQIIHDFFFNPKEYQSSYGDQYKSENSDGFIIELDLTSERINVAVCNSIRNFYSVTLKQKMTMDVNTTQQTQDISKAFHDGNELSSHNINIPNWIVFAEKFLTAMQHYAYRVVLPEFWVLSILCLKHFLGKFTTGHLVF